MRKLLITLLVVIALAVMMSITWIYGGRQLVTLLDRYRTIEINSTPITSLAYEGTGSGGTLLVNDLRFALDQALPQSPPPNVGTTKDGQLAISLGGKIFAFGPVQETAPGNDEALATALQAGDEAFVAIKHSALEWIEPFKLNFMTGQSPSRKRHIYYQLVWKKSSGKKLGILWRYEQHFSPDSGWGSGFMTRENSTGLIRIEISP